MQYDRSASLISHLSLCVSAACCESDTKHKHKQCRGLDKCWASVCCHHADKLELWSSAGEINQQLSHSVQMYCPQRPGPGPRAITNNMEHRLTCTSNCSHLPPVFAPSPDPHQYFISASSKLSTAATYFVYQHYKIVSLYLMTGLGDLHPHNSDLDHV